MAALNAQTGAVQDDLAPAPTINTTPLVDIMLVLLIIFLVTATVAVQAVKLKLPDVRFDPTTTKPENVSLAITSKPDGTMRKVMDVTKIRSLGWKPKLDLSRGILLTYEDFRDGVVK